MLEGLLLKPDGSDVIRAGVRVASTTRRHLEPSWAESCGTRRAPGSGYANGSKPASCQAGAVQPGSRKHLNSIDP